MTSLLTSAPIRGADLNQTDGVRYDDDSELDNHFRTRRHNGVLLIVILISLGVVLLILGALTRESLSTSKERSVFLEVLEFLLSHLGVALFVAGWAGIGYEFFAHYKHLQDQIVTLFKINRRLAASQLYAVLEKLIPIEHDARNSGGVRRDLRADIAETVLAIARIESQPIKASEVSLKFIWRLQRYARDAAVALETKDEHILKLPTTSAALADEILAGQAASMVDGDTYDVVSDFSTWRNDQLPQFWAALKKSIEDKNVTVRRVFCYFSHDADLIHKEASEILRSHWCLAEATIRGAPLLGKYYVGISLHHERNHVGVFTLSKKVTCFKPLSEGDLSLLTVSRSADMHDFNRHWSAAIRVMDDNGNVTKFADVRRIIEERAPKFFAQFRGPTEACEDIHTDCECWQALKNDATDGLHRPQANVT